MPFNKTAVIKRTARKLEVITATKHNKIPKLVVRLKNKFKNDKITIGVLPQPRVLITEYNIT